MNFKTFATRPLADYVKMVRSNPSLWIFQHVPKTAGSSVLHEMSGLLPPYCNIHASFEDPKADHRQLMIKSVEDFIATQAYGYYKSASGHLAFYHMRLIREALPDSKFFSILRNPVDRVISEYRYMCTPVHPFFREHIKTYPTIEDFIADDRHTNKMSRLMCPQAQIKLGNASRYVSRNYYFIGFVEDYQLTFRFLTQMMIGVAITPTIRANETHSLNTNSAPITEEIRNKIQERNNEDFALYQNLYQIYQQKRPEMENFVKTSLI